MRQVPKWSYRPSKELKCYTSITRQDTSTEEIIVWEAISNVEGIWYKGRKYFRINVKGFDSPLYCKEDQGVWQGLKWIESDDYK